MASLAGARQEALLMLGRYPSIRGTSVQGQERRLSCTDVMSTLTCIAGLIRNLECLLTTFNRLTLRLTACCQIHHLSGRILGRDKTAPRRPARHLASSMLFADRHG